jgi:Ca2+-binding EF-hand superfamily protein
MIERADSDGDGVVSEEEFYNLITKKSHWNMIYANKNAL